jgi:hypothetical protein
MFCKNRCTKDIAIDNISYCYDFLLTGKEKTLPIKMEWVLAQNRDYGPLVLQLHWST